MRGGQRRQRPGHRPDRPQRRPDDDRPAVSEPIGEAADPLGLLDRVLYRDDHIIVIDKPAGLAVHAGPKGGLTLEDGLEALRLGGPRRPGLAHRLDKDTSGCLVLGRDRETLNRLGRMFHSGRVQKTYWAVVEGHPKTDRGRIALGLSKRTKGRGWWMRVDPKGQPAETFFQVMGRSDRFSFLELSPKTGRTHQLRVHCSTKGWPILGDPIYGKAVDGGPRLHLHARSISLPGGKGQKAVTVTAPVPEDMAAALRLCGWEGRERESVI